MIGRDSLSAATRGVTLLALAAALAVSLVLGVAGGAHLAWAVLAGWAIGGFNAFLLRRRIDLMLSGPGVRGFLFGTGLRFALVGMSCLVAYKLLSLSPIGLAIGLALVPLMGVPYGLMMLSKERV